MAVQDIYPLTDLRSCGVLTNSPFYHSSVVEPPGQKSAAQLPDNVRCCYEVSSKKA